MKVLSKSLLLLTFLLLAEHAWSSSKIDADLIAKMEMEILELMDEGDIPGISVVLINGNEQKILNYGYIDSKSERAVTPETLFEIGSCSKAFTGLAITNLEQGGLLDLSDNVSNYIPWLELYYEEKKQEVTLRQLLYHTSGIPWNTIALIPESNTSESLQETIKQLIGHELSEVPGERFEYATINYDVLALVIEKVTKQPYEVYVQEEIINPLKLTSTTIGVPFDPLAMASGHKVSFFEAREYDAPIYKGNYAAGYVISNAKDFSRWIKLQMGLVKSDYLDMIEMSQQRDETVPLHQMAAYARGWNVLLDGSGEIQHGGLNPNFSAYVAFRRDDEIGVGILANSNSSYTPMIGDKLMKLLAGEEIEREFDPGDGNDKTYSGITIALILYILLVIGFIGLILVDAIKGKRKYDALTLPKGWKFIKSVVALGPFVFGLYLLPQAMASFTWEAITVWTPLSFTAMILALLCAAGISYVAGFVALCFPENNEYIQKVPKILLISILSGLANVAVIIVVTSAIDSESELKYLIFFYVLIIAVYLFGRRFVQINLIKLTRGLVYDLRIKLINKTFSTSYQKFERIHRGRIYTALNDDVNTIGQSTNLFVMLITSVITAVGAFLYLASIAFWATLLTIFLIITISALYYFASKRTNIYFEQARDSRDVFMRLINGLIDGFKEVSLHQNKKLEYRADVAASAHEFREKSSTADINFVNAFLVGESLLVILLGLVSIGMVEIFPNVKAYTIMSFVIVLLYLIGPVNGILGAVPALMNLRIAWNRVNQFIEEIPANLDLDAMSFSRAPEVDKLEVKGVEFSYQNTNENEVFNVGPIDLKVTSGQVLFIIGGNGSGKTTLAKLLTGLYEPDAGEILINGENLKNYELSEYFSTVFSPSFLFDKLYNVDVKSKKESIEHYLKLLDLEDKVTITEDGYSTIQLSGGQRKRLALLQCYLEDSPIYLFDEWAADQDPGYRNFFYRTLLPDMKKQGKIVIAITHDDQYFDVADKVVMMKLGQLQLANKESVASTFA